MFIPIEKYSKTDMIALFNGRLQKIQIKSASCTAKNINSLRVELTARPGRGKKFVYEEDDVDYFGIMNMVNGDLYLIKYSDVVGRKAISIGFDDYEGYSKLKAKDILIDRVLSMTS